MESPFVGYFCLATCLSLTSKMSKYVSFDRGGKFARGKVYTILMQRATKQSLEGLQPMSQVTPYQTKKTTYMKYFVKTDKFMSIIFMTYVSVMYVTVQYTVVVFYVVIHSVCWSVMITMNHAAGRCEAQLYNVTWVITSLP